MRKYAIVCGSRSGSTFLCDLLDGTNRCGRPREYFNKCIQEELRPKEYSLKEYKEKLFRYHKTNNDVFGTKLIVKKDFEEFLRSGISLENWKWIHLYREDSLLQAISRYIAVEKYGWHRQVEPPEYSRDKIQKYLNDVLDENEYISKFLEPLNHITISYEADLCASPESTLVSIVNFLEISADELPIVVTDINKKPEEPNLTWKKRFLEEF